MEQGIGKITDSSFIICTKDRHQDMVQCVKAILKQTVLPKELMVIDAGRTQALEATIAGLLKDSKINFIYRSTRPNLPYQRNVGIRLAKGSIVFFLDDDVVLDQNYHEKILSVYAMDKKGELGGVIGTIKNRVRNPLFGRMLRCFFLLEGWDNRFAKLPSFPIDKKNLTAICGLIGCQMSFRREVLKRYTFDENMGKVCGYAYLEDNELAYRVSREYVLLKTKLARADHNVSPVARENICKHQELLILNSYYFFRKNFPKNTISYAIFLWQEIGLFLHAIGQAIRKRDVGWFTGVLKAYRRLLFCHKDY